MWLRALHSACFLGGGETKEPLFAQLCNYLIQNTCLCEGGEEMEFHIMDLQI